MRTNLKERAVEIRSEEPDFSSEIFLTEEDISKLIDSADNRRDKALISVLWETGARLGELYEFKISDLSEWEQGFIVSINGYTGERELPLIESTTELRNWLKEHPKTSEGDAYVWIDQEERISYNYIRKTIKDLFEKANIDKISDANHFRRSRAAFLANWLDEDEIKYWFGWEKVSDLSGMMEGCSSCAGCPFSCKAR